MILKYRSHRIERFFKIISRQLSHRSGGGANLAQYDQCLVQGIRHFQILFERLYDDFIETSFDQQVFYISWIREGKWPGTRESGGETGAGRKGCNALPARDIHGLALGFCQQINTSLPSSLRPLWR